MFRQLSPFIQSGFFALLLALDLVLSGGALAQDHPRRGPTLVMPADGATVAPHFIVRIGFAGGGPRGPAEGTGIPMDAPPPPPPDAPPPPHSDWAPRGPSEGTGLGAREHHHGPHFVLLIDQQAMESGVPFHADAQHLSFPAGLPQMTVTLPPGPHKLVLQTLDHDGNIILRYPPEAITVTVK